MRKKLIKAFVAVILVIAMTGITVFADDINKTTNDKNSAQKKQMRRKEEAYLSLR